MAIRVKDPSAAAQKFTQNAGISGKAYADGVSAAGPAWLAATKASGETWSQGVQQAAQSGRFAAGVTQASQDKFVARAAGVGQGRYQTGVATAGPAWQAGTTPYLDVIKGLNLPPRQPRGNPANQLRSAMVATALRNKKVGAAQ